MTLDHAGITPNPARDKQRVRLPKGDTAEIRPPSADHVTDALRALARRYRLGVIVLDNTAMRVGELEGLRWGDMDEPRGRWLVRGELNHTGRDRWVAPEEIVLDAVASLVPREDRDPDALVFPPSRPGQSLQGALRTELGRACKAAGVPHFSPHALRHRRISLWHKQGKDWALVGAMAGQVSKMTTADTYTHVLLDDAELDLPSVLELAGVPQQVGLLD
jgi:integrase